MAVAKKAPAPAPKIFPKAALRSVDMVRASVEVAARAARTRERESFMVLFQFIYVVNSAYREYCDTTRRR